MKGNALVAQTGGPTSVINASLAGIISQSLREKSIRRVFGCRWGMLGLMNDWLVDLGREKPATLRTLRTTPSSALGSSRYKLKPEDMPHILEIFRKHNIRYFFGIGGNDTMLNVHQIERYCRQNGYELFGMGCPKTVDNDLFGTDHTPGFPSAARYVALSVLQAGVLARDMQKVDHFVVYQTIGRDGGWLAAAAAAARRSPADAPHIILMPEVPFDREKFFAAFEEAHKAYGWVSIVCGEGIVDANGVPVSASTVKDGFSNTEFGAMGGTSAAMMLHRMLTARFNVRGEFQVPESLPMCAADRATKMDFDEAFQLGVHAVKLAAGGSSGLMASVVRAKGRTYRTTLGSIPLNDVAAKTKPMPREFISEDGFGVTDAFLAYIKPLIGPLPEYARLRYASAR